MPRQSPSHPSNDENNSSGSNSSNNNDMNGGGEKISKVRTRFAFEGEPSDGVLRPANAADRSTVRAVPAGERPQGRSFSLWSSDKSAEQGADEGRSDDVADVTASASASATTCSKNHRVITSAEAAAIATATAGIASSRDSAEEGEVVYGETEEQCGGGIVSVSVLRGNEQVGVELAEEEYEEHDGRENDDNRIPAVGSLPGCFGDGLDLIGVSGHSFKRLWLCVIC